MTLARLLAPAVKVFVVPHGSFRCVPAPVLQCFFRRQCRMLSLALCLQEAVYDN